MRIKVFLIFISIITLGICGNIPSNAMEPTDCTNEKYLLDHGHSKEIVRMINLQKDRTEGKAVVAPKSEWKIKKFFKNIWFEQDLTLPVNDFGFNDIKTTETDKLPTIPKIKHKDKKPKNEIKENADNVLNINDIKIRETKPEENK